MKKSAIYSVLLFLVIACNEDTGQYENSFSDFDSSENISVGSQELPQAEWTCNKKVDN
jgi:hypothetical protein